MWLVWKHEDFHCAGDQALAQAAQGGGGLALLGDIQNPFGFWMSWLWEALLEQETGPDELQKSLSTSTLLWVCECRRLCSIRACLLMAKAFLNEKLNKQSLDPSVKQQLEEPASLEAVTLPGTSNPCSVHLSSLNMSCWLPFGTSAYTVPWSMQDGETEYYTLGRRSSSPASLSLWLITLLFYLPHEVHFCFKFILKSEPNTNQITTALSQAFNRGIGLFTTGP